MNKTKIEWCDYTWNPIVGCSPISAGCEHCYAAGIARRFRLPWGSAHFMPARLEHPMRTRKAGRVFVCSMADIGHATVKEEWRKRIWAAMRAAPWHQYVVLTKRPGPWLRAANPTGAWVGVTVENQEMAETRIPALLKTPHEMIRFVSVEPMLGPVNLRAVRFPTGAIEDVLRTDVSERARPIVGKLNGIDWVIAGPETGPKARPCEGGWIEALAAQSPCFFDKRKKVDGIRREWPGGWG